MSDLWGESPPGGTPHHPRDKLFGPRPRWGFTLFLLAERPACHLISTQRLISKRGVAECWTRPEAFARSDYVGQLLREVEVSYCLVVLRPEPVPDESLIVDYYVAADPKRIGLLLDPYRTPADESVPPDSEKMAGSWSIRRIPSRPPGREREKGAWLSAVPPSRIEAAAGHLLNEVLIPDRLARYQVLDRVLPYLPPRPADGPPKPISNAPPEI